ncbi:P-loop containing nucleoside triphosphate hydrolase protein [Pavlovales sp. CCMP2436]|nr:P-loop containing nucleoside triphosphate hydrolase protein [Pavlovales sp. CCMP2436]
MGALVKLQRECEALNARFEDARGQLGVREGDNADLQAEVAMRASYVQELEAKLHDAEETRRRLHNTVQELKGNIRVFCRVRPPNDEGASCLDLKPDGESVGIATVSAGEKSARESAHLFSFDKVFAPGTAQANVFGEVSSLVQSALDGYKVCIFAYGQTGSGKTFTMQGTSDAQNCGIVPRSLKQIFKATADAKAKGWTYSLNASFIEVYNENVRDLLAPPGAPAANHTIVHDEAFGTVVTETTRIAVTCEAQVDELAHMAARQRSVGKTDMNSVSSRSHAIFMLYLTGTNPSVGHTLNGALHLVDLAGSERLARSGATGATLKETLAINKSLSALGDVFASITNKASHVPFRNSKLTYLMAPCLSGDGKTLMVVNVAPEADNGLESLSSLRFASQVNACEIGKPKRTLKAGVVSEAPAENSGERSARPSISSVQSAAISRPSTAGARGAPVSIGAAATAAGAGRKPASAAAAAAAARRPAMSR